MVEYCTAVWDSSCELARYVGGLGLLYRLDNGHWVSLREDGYFPDDMLLNLVHSTFIEKSHFSKIRDTPTLDAIIMVAFSLRIDSNNYQEAFEIGKNIFSQSNEMISGLNKMRDGQKDSKVTKLLIDYSPTGKLAKYFFDKSKSVSWNDDLRWVRKCCADDRWVTHAYVPSAIASTWLDIGEGIPELYKSPIEAALKILEVLSNKKAVNIINSIIL
jgi:hypothetical protein